MRIKNLKVLYDTFERRINFEEKKDDKPPKLIRLVLEIDKSLAYRVYDEFNEHDIELLNNGDFKITTELPFNDWIYGYILSFGSKVKVIEPLYIKEDIIKDLKESLDNYL